MSKPLIMKSASAPDSKGVFGPGAKALRVGLYARVSTHDQKTLPLQLSAMRDYAKKRNWIIAIEVQDVRSRVRSHDATQWPPEEDAHRGGPPARDRLCPGLATGSLGGGRWWT